MYSVSMYVSFCICEWSLYIEFWFGPIKRICVYVCALLHKAESPKSSRIRLMTIGLSKSVLERNIKYKMKLHFFSVTFQNSVIMGCTLDHNNQAISKAED